MNTHTYLMATAGGAFNKHWAETGWRMVFIVGLIGGGSQIQRQVSSP